MNNYIIPVSDSMEIIYESSKTVVFKLIDQDSQQPLIAKQAKDKRHTLNHGSVAKEWKLTRKLNPNNIAKAKNLQLINDIPTLIFDDENTHSLRGNIPKNGLPFDPLLKLALDICKCINDIHLAGLIHRDINPGNILCNRELGQIKIIDFGSASHFQEQQLDYTSELQQAGTLDYISPEQTGRINHPIDHRTDLYSLGASLFEFASGRKLYPSREAADIIYSHIAVPAPKLADSRPDLPKVFGKVIARLLEKNPNDRYQSCNEILEDLLAMKSHYEENQNLDGFNISSPKTETINNDDNIYCREKEKQTLLDAYSRSHHSSVVQLCGPSGIGKTSLIRSTFSELSRNNDFYIQGKYSLQRKGQDYSAILLALEQLAFQLISDKSKNWPKVIANHCKGQIPLLYKLVPAFKNINYAAVKQEQIDSQGADLRLQAETLISSLLALIGNILSERQRRMIIFLDDLQWMDSSSAYLLDKILAQKPSAICFIIAYRDQEINSNPSALDLLSKIDKSNLEKTQITLDLLDEARIDSWLSQQFGLSVGSRQLLASELYKRGQGNPFYTSRIIKSLVQKNILKKRDIGFHLDKAALKNLPFINGHEQLLDDIEALPHKQRIILSHCSILGNNFDIDDLRLLCSKDIDKPESELRELIEKGYLLNSGEQIHYSHDKVLESAASKLSHEEYLALNLKLAESMFKSGERSAAAFINYYNKAIELISCPEKLKFLAELNFNQAQEHLKKAAFNQAHHHLITASELIQGLSSASENIDFLCQIKLSLAKILLLLDHHDQAELELDWILRNSSSHGLILESHKTKAHHAWAVGKPKLARKALKDIMKLCGVPVPKKSNPIHILYSYFSLIANNKMRKPETFLNSKPLTDSKISMEFDALSFCLLASQVYAPWLLPYIAMFLVKQSAKHGVCDSTALALISMANIAMMAKHYRLTEMYSNTALKLCESYNNPHVSAKVNFIYAISLHHWHHPMLEATGYLQRSIEQSEMICDYETASLATTVYSAKSFHGGMPVSDLLKQQERLRSAQYKYNKPLALSHCMAYSQFFLALDDPSSVGLTVSGEFFDDSRTEEYIKLNGADAPMGSYFTDKALIQLIQGNYEKTLEVCRFCLPAVLQNPAVSYYIPMVCFCTAVSSLQILRQKGFSLKNYILYRKARKLLRSCAKQNPGNFRGKLLILLALEQENSRFNQEKCETYYVEAQKFLREHGPLQELAYCEELYARRLINKGKDDLGQYKMAQALELYKNWGLKSKIAAILKEFPKLSQPSKTQAIEETHTGQIGLDIDISSIAKSIEKLSGSLDYESLLQDLSNLLLKNSGATKVAILAPRKDKLELLTSNQTASGTEQSIPSHLVLRFISDGKSEQLFNQANGQLAPSILMLALKSKGELLGVAYLENSLLPNAFDPTQLRVLKLLSGQAAIALDNAKAFGQLQTERNNINAIINSVPTLVFTLHKGAIIRYINPEVTRVLGYSPEEASGQNLWDLLFRNIENIKASKRARATENGELSNYQFPVLSRSGDTRMVMWSSIRKSTQGDAQETLLFGVDISQETAAKEKVEKLNSELQSRVEQRTKELQNSVVELQQTQAQLVESEKAAALSRLVAGVAHEINTPIGIGVTGSTGLFDQIKFLEKAYHGGDLSQEKLESFILNSKKTAQLIHSNLGRAADLITSFKQVSVDQSSEQIRQFKVLEYIEQVITSLENQFKTRDIHIKVDCPIDLEIVSYPGLLAQILTNLIMNSLTHAFDEGDSGTIDILCESKDERLLIKHIDNGKGISKSNIAKVFEPFFTTRSGSGGSGLGLNIVHNLVKQNLNGNIRCESDMGQGCSFIIEFPLKPIVEK